MGYVIRKYKFDGPPPSLAELVASAQKKGALQISFDGDVHTADIAFECHCPGIIGLNRKDDTVFLSGESAHASVLIDLLDVCMREAGGIARLQDSTACALPLPLTEAFIAHEVRRMNRIASAVLLSLSTVAILVLAGSFWVAWLIIRIVSNAS